MFAGKRQKTVFGALLVFFTGVSLLFGFFAGQRYPSLEGAVNRVSHELSSWRLEFFSSDLSEAGKVGIWVSPFQPRFSGTSEETIFMTEDRTVYTLLTKQERIHKKMGKPILVVENPAGFFNGRFSSSIPHAWAEDIEREAEKAFKQDGKKHRGELYASQVKRLDEEKRKGKGWPAYVEDASLADTGVRETAEETGFHPKDFEKNLIATEYAAPFETQTVFVMRVKKFYRGHALPALKKTEGGEILDVKWVRLGRYDAQNKFVRDEGLQSIHEGKIKFGETMETIKPWDYLLDNLLGTIDRLEKSNPYRLS